MAATAATGYETVYTCVTLVLCGSVLSAGRWTLEVVVVVIVWASLRGFIDNDESVSKVFFSCFSFSHRLKYTQLASKMKSLRCF